MSFRIDLTRRKAGLLRVELLEDRTLLSGSSLALPLSISPIGTVVGQIAMAGAADFYQVTLAESEVSNLTLEDYFTLGNAL